MNSKLILWSITVGLGGFLFGLDTAVISGAEQDIQKLWNLDGWQHGLAVAMALYGTVFGAAFGGIPADKFGRKKTLLWIGILFFVSSVGAALAGNVNVFMLASACFFVSSVISCLETCRSRFFSMLTRAFFRGSSAISINET